MEEEKCGGNLHGAPLKRRKDVWRANRLTIRSLLGADLETRMNAAPKRRLQPLTVNWFPRKKKEKEKGNQFLREGSTGG